ncbi:hypothetical protein T05_1193 [Trichinella murrelli]|uniref:Uncharacterized protein n=1 Tax=Trichinella murrelli TaxID=144512 RepID=A0A0V0TA31_9BILA|nr:hypothetical protein T05_1193 [Trichinella murrelli]
MYLVKGILYSRDTLSCLLGVLTSFSKSQRGRLRVYIKDMPLHTLIGYVMDAISKKDHVDSPFY